MNAATDLATYDVTSEDIEYQRIDGEPLLARVHRPRGAGPFPAVVGVHGGAWTGGDRTNNAAIDQALATAGTVVMALDFRIAPRWPYPASVADVNFGIRWLKAHAAQFDTRADWVGAVGSSSGAQQMLLNALRPRDPRYAATTAPGLRALTQRFLCGGVLADLDPLARYHMAKCAARAAGAGAPRFLRHRRRDARGQSAAHLERGER
jgi:acetyl esterase/lipase